MQILEDETIQACTGGWRSVRVVTTSKATNTAREWDVHWRARNHTCGEKTSNLPPVWEDGSYGDLRSSVTSHNPDSWCYGKTEVVIREVRH
ncbi:MAG: hypothetical protein ACYCU8_00810 [Ferrimicrobium acidiphilum]